MDKFLLLLLMLGALPVSFFPPVGSTTVCMVCKTFKDGWCQEEKGNCTVKDSSVCRTRIVYVENKKEWLYDHTVLDCSVFCNPGMTLLSKAVMLEEHCCTGRDFCNIHPGKLKKRNF